MRKKERPGLPRRYTFKLAPTPAQEAAMLEQCRMIAMMWNALLEMNERLYQRTCGQKGVVHDGAGAFSKSGRWKPVEKTMLTHFDMGKLITTLRRECPEWRQFSSWTGNRVASSLERAFKGFFRRAKEGAGASSGYPKYRSVHKANWIPHIFHSGIKLKPSQGTSKKKWRLELPGVPGYVLAQGKFPSKPLVFTDSDIRQLQGSWWLSVCVDLAPRREPGHEAGEVRFNLVDTFADIKGDLPAPPQWGDILAMQDRMDAIKAERDTRYPRKPGQRPSCNWRRMTGRIGKLSARIARIRRERLHEWTTATVARCGSLAVVAPPVKESTATARGDEREWGAAVEIVAKVNRHALSQAPASAVAMLEYKAKEAGIPIDVREDARPPIAIGGVLSEATKAVRKARRALRKASENGQQAGNGRAGGGHQGRDAARRGSAGAQSGREAGPSRV
jgi:transposase